ncbi:MAG: lamin tail domain-containing protein [Kiritimatiellae bacterium]|nr:lamin tail domain-containing protein [Kiritimatiellia bacterium]
MKRGLQTLCMVALGAGLAAGTRAETLVARQSTWLYRKGTAEASDPIEEWRRLDFGDSGWPAGQAPFGYGYTVNTSFPDMQSRYTTFFLRKAFVVDDAAGVSDLKAHVGYDDGFVLWINGEEVLACNAPDGAPRFDSRASAGHPAGTYETNALPDPGDYLETGTNVVAVQVLNVDPTSSDCVFDLELISYRGVSDTTFSHDRGFYDTAFVCTVSTATAGASIRYTLDGSHPLTSGSAVTIGASSGTVLIDPASTAGRLINGQVAGAVVLRACAVKAGYEPTNVDTHTYVFPDRVAQQKNLMQGEDWGGGEFEYEKPVGMNTEMDPAIVSRFGAARIVTGLKSVPTLSIVADYAGIFGNSYGIYHWPNTEERGDLWERPGSAELIYPPGYKGVEYDGFQTDCGIRLQGGGSRMIHQPKHSFRLCFRSTYGAAKLHYPFFEDAPHHADSAEDTFNTIVIRAGNNRGWNSRQSYKRATSVYVRDQWVRDSQLAMSGVAGHGLFVHLYVNGIYWGLYNPSERTDEVFASDYYGGSKEDWFAVNHDGDVTDTALYPQADDRYDHLLNYVAANNLATQLHYDHVTEYLDIDQYCDYMALNNFAGTGDWPNGNWWGGNRNTPPGTMKFFSWDAEDCLYFELNRSHDGAWVNPWMNSGLGTAGKFWVNLRVANDFKIAFADRLYRQCFNNGPLTKENGQARFGRLFEYVHDAMFAESARWGDCKADGTTYNPPDHWYAETNRVSNMLNTNVADMVSVFRAHYNMYPSLDPPQFHQHGGAVASGFRLTVSSPHSAASGTIYYTLDGSDPRAPGGSRRPAAIAYSGPIPISTTTHVKARLYKANNTWSAAHAATFNFTAHYARIRITEILYNPLGGSDYEFIEIKNSGSSTRGLSEMTMRGVGYTFPPGAELAAGEFAVLVRSAAVFTNACPAVANAVRLFGEYRGKLDNGGERLALLDAEGLTVTSVRYNDRNGWPREADGAGHSLVPVAEDGYYGDESADDAATWRASNLIGGSPGRDDGPHYRLVVNEALTHTDLPQVDAIELYNAGAAAADLGGWYLSDSDTDYFKFQIPAATTLGAGQYVVFDEHDFNIDTNDPACFGLNSHGDVVYLTKWDGADLQYLAEARFGGAENGAAFGRHVTSEGESDFVAQSVSNTLGAANAYPAVGPIVINELMYHPAAGGDEFIELYNLSDSAVPLYDPAYPANRWELDGAVWFTFPGGAELDARAYALVVATDPATFRSTYGIAADVAIFGPYSGVLDNGGESVKLWRPDTPDEEGVPRILVDRVKYDDNSPWPESADGSGPSLERQSGAHYGNDPANWAASRVAGGTPGAPNSGALVPVTAGWKFYDRGVDLGPGWRTPAYDDATWEDGNAPLGYADTGEYPELDTEISYGDDPANKHPTTYFRKTFTLGVAPGTVTNLVLSANYDDGYVAYLNGQEIARQSLPAGPLAYTTWATSHTASGFESIDVTSHADKLLEGVNVLAVEVHQSGASSTDMYMDIELACAAEAGHPPAPPQNLVAAAASSTRINVTWTDASDNETGFKLDRRQTGASDWIRVTTTGPNVSTYSDTGLAAGTLYYYKVKAYNGDGNSSYTDVADATTQPGPPAAPTGLVAIPATTSRIQVTWTDQSGNETGFKIERSPTGTSSWQQISTVGVDVTSHADSGLPQGTTYDYRVRAYNAIGDSAYSGTAQAGTLAASVQFAASSSTGKEDVSPAAPAVALNAACTDPVRVDYAVTGGTATGADYANGSGTLTFNPGVTSLPVAVTIVDDDLEEPAETLVFTLSSPANAQLGARTTHTYTILDNDTLWTAYNDLAWFSGQHTLNITRYSNAGTTNGGMVDYQSGAGVGVSLSVAGGGGLVNEPPSHPASGTDAYSVFNGMVDCDGYMGYKENLTLAFTGLDPGLRYEFVIYGNRAEPSYTDRTMLTTIRDVTTFRNTSTPGAQISGSDDDSTLVYCGDNTANGYVARFTNIDPGTDGDMTITVEDNTTKFYANALMLRAMQPLPDLPLVAFAQVAKSGPESASPVSVTVALAAAASNEVRVSYAATGGTATSGADYALAAGVLTFNPGQTTKSISFTVIDDTAEEPDETVVVTLSNAINALIGDGTHTYTIADNDVSVRAWAAYNDLHWVSGQTAVNITTYSTTNGNETATASGALRDHASGATVAATLTVTGGNRLTPAHETQGANPASGTDAYAVFNGIVDSVGLVASGDAPDIRLMLTGLDPAMTYEVVLYGNRAETAYTDRLTTSTIQDVDSFENYSSAGADFSGVSDASVTICNGGNTTAGQIARFTRIVPGSDGDFEVVVTSPSGGYYANALMLKAFSSQDDDFTVKLGKGTVWHCAKGTREASEPPGAWRLPGFDDSGWSAGAAPFGYGTGPFGTTLDDMQYTYSTVFLRQEFTLSNPYLVNGLRLRADYDDGFIVWINGEEVERVNVPGGRGAFVPFDSFSAASEHAAWTDTYAAADLPALRPTNIVAVQVFNSSLSSSDLMMDFELALDDSPLVPPEDDADSDGMPDDWEDAHLAGTGQGALGDKDGDGVCNIAEWIAGSDPDAHADFFQVSLSASGGNLTVSFPTVPASGTGYAGRGRYYALECRVGLDENGAWQAVTNLSRVIGSGSDVRHIDALGSSAPVYYRGRVWLE